MHPHALLRMSLVVMVASIACFTMSGCGKQQKVAPAKMPQVSKEPSAGAADTADIFKEFYSEDSTKKKAGAKSKKAARQETFSPSSSSQPAFSPKGRYTVQITCVRSKSFADNMTSKMKDKGYPAYVAEVQNPTPNLSGTFYRVRIGGFDGLSAAKSFGENTLVSSGYQYWVDKKANDNVGMEGYGLGSGSAGSNAAGSYDNAPAAAAPATTPVAAPASSYDSPNNTYSSPSSSSSTSSAGSSAAASGTPSTYQPPATTTGSAAAPASPQPVPASSASSTTSPAPSAAASSAPAAASTGTQTGSSAGTTGATTGKASTGSSTESGWGTDSSSKSGW
jgi:SPOR domain